MSDPIEPAPPAPARPDVPPMRPAPPLPTAFPAPSGAPAPAPGPGPQRAAPPYPQQPYPQQQTFAGPAPQGAYVAPYAVPRPPSAGIQPPEPAAKGRTLGIGALALALLAAVGASAVGAASAWQLGFTAGRGSASAPLDADFDWSVLAPVREWALAGEVSLWVGTALGIAAIVTGIIALVTQRGRVPGMIAVVVAALGPIVFFAAVATTLSAALSAGSGVGG